MQSQIIKLLIDLQEQLNFINIEVDDPIVACEQAIEIWLKSVENKNNFLENIFKF